MGATSASLTKAPARAKQPFVNYSTNSPPRPLGHAHAVPPRTALSPSFVAIPTFSPGELATGCSPGSHFPSLPLQKKVAVGAANDPLEAEADAVAERVMRMPTLTKPGSSAGGWILQRKCACGSESTDRGECAECKKKRENVFQGPATHAGTSATAAPPIVDEILRSPGHPLDSSSRLLMESRFGRNFSSVRVHTDARAAESVRAVHAKAFTFGQDIYFGAGHYAPHTSTGMQLLAHELVHTIQQGSPRPGATLAVESPHSAQEQQAASIARGANGQITSTVPAVQRDVEDTAGSCSGPGLSALQVGAAAHKQIQGFCSNCFSGVPAIKGAGENGGNGFPDLVRFWNYREAKAFPGTVQLPPAPNGDQLEVALTEIGEIKPDSYSVPPGLQKAQNQLGRYLAGWTNEGRTGVPVPMQSFRGLPPVPFVANPVQFIGCAPIQPGLYIYSCTRARAGEEPEAKPATDAVKDQEKTKTQARRQARLVGVHPGFGQFAARMHLPVLPIDRDLIIAVDDGLFTEVIKAADDMRMDQQLRLMQVDPRRVPMIQMTIPLIPLAVLAGVVEVALVGAAVGIIIAAAGPEAAAAAGAVTAGESAAATSGGVTLTVIQGGGQAAAQGAGRVVIETLSKAAAVTIAAKVTEKTAQADEAVRKLADKRVLAIIDVTGDPAGQSRQLGTATTIDGQTFRAIAKITSRDAIP